MSNSDLYNSFLFNSLGSKPAEPYAQEYRLADKAYFPTKCGTVEECKPMGYAIPKKEEKKMRYENATAANVAVNLQADPDFSKEKNGQEYLISRLRDVLVRKRDSEELQKKFNLLSSRFKSSRELVQAIKDGKITFSYENEEEEIEDYGNRYRYPHDLISCISFRDPKVKADRTGWKNAVEQIEKDAKDVKDQIMVMSLEDGLKALKEFEAKDYVNT